MVEKYKLFYNIDHDVRSQEYHSPVWTWLMIFLATDPDGAIHALNLMISPL